MKSIFKFWILQNFIKLLCRKGYSIICTLVFRNLLGIVIYIEHGILLVQGIKFAPIDKEMDEGMLIELKCNIVIASDLLIGA